MAFDLAIEKIIAQRAFVKTESGGYLFNLTSTIVFKLETAEQQEEYCNKLSKYLFRDNALIMIGFFFESIFDLPTDLIALVVLFMNWHCRVKFWPGVYSYFADELASTPRGSFTQFTLLKAQEDHSKTKFNYVKSCSFSIISSLLLICLISLSAPLLPHEIYAEINWVVSIGLAYIAYYTGARAWRLKSVLR